MDMEASIVYLDIFVLLGLIVGSPLLKVCIESIEDNEMVGVSQTLALSTKKIYFHFILFSLAENVKV